MWIEDGLLTPEQMWAVALEKCPENRWLAKLDSSISLGLDALPKDVRLYAPMTAQLTSGSGALPKVQRQNRHA